MAAETKEKKEVYWTPENGFDLGFITIKDVAKAAKISRHGVKENVINLLKAMPVEGRILVLEHMLAAKEKKEKNNAGETQ